MQVFNTCLCEAHEDRRITVIPHVDRTPPRITMAVIDGFDF